MLAAVGAGCAGGSPGMPPAAVLQDEGAPAIHWVEEPAADLRRRLQAGLGGIEAGAGSVDSLLAALAARGYLEVTLCREAGGGWRAEARPRVAAVRLEISPDSLVELLGAAGEELGVPVERRDLGRMLDAEIRALLADCDEAGFPLARARFLDYTADSELVLQVAVDPGPRVWLGELRFSGQKTSRPSFLRRVAGWRGPEPYRASRWREVRAQLAATGLFETIEGPMLLVRGDAGPAGARDTLDAALLIHLRERPASQIQGLLGYSDRESSVGGEAIGLTGFLDVRLANLLGTGRATRIFWEGWGPERSTFLFSWHEPFLWRLPLAIDGALEHVQEDTLFAQTEWRGDLLWSPGSLWDFGIGWGRTRLVLGGALGRTLGRETTRFLIERRAAETPGELGWSGRGQLSQISGDDPTVRRLELELDECWAGAHWRVEWEQLAGLLTGPDSLLRSDAFLLGGNRSLRGSYEGEWRSTAYVIQRLAGGPRIDREGTWAYLLFDAGWLRDWDPTSGGLRGVAGSRRLVWATGLGLQAPSRAGRVRIEYAVPGGEAILRGRLHLGVSGAF